MNLVELIIDFKRHLKVLELLGDEPPPDEIGDDQRDYERGQQGRGDLGGGLNLACGDRWHQERSQPCHGEENARSHWALVAKNIV